MIFDMNVSLNERKLRPILTVDGRITGRSVKLLKSDA